MIFGAESQIMSSPHDLRCDCGAHVTLYTCNQPVTQLRPEAVESDWWASCNNTNCKNNYGEGFFQDYPDWVHK